MIRFYANQAGYLPKGHKIVVLAQENRADEMEKMQDKKVSLWNEKGEQTAVKQAVYAGVDESAEAFTFLFQSQSTETLCGRCPSRLPVLLPYRDISPPDSYPRVYHYLNHTVPI